jgi:hypothetical protein
LKLFKLLFTDFLLILAQETNRYCHQYYAAKDDDSPASQDVSVEGIFLFLALILKMGHDHRDILKEYWSRDPMCQAAFHLNLVETKQQQWAVSAKDQGVVSRSRTLSPSLPSAWLHQSDVKYCFSERTGRPRHGGLSL